MKIAVQMVRLGGKVTLKVLVVDDQPLFHEMVQDLIGPAVDLLVAADNNDAALVAVSVHKLDGAIVDVNVAGSNGFQLANQLAACRPAIKIIVTSADGSPIYEELAHTIPQAMFIEKRHLSTEGILSFFGSSP